MCYDVQKPGTEMQSFIAWKGCSDSPISSQMKHPLEEGPSGCMLIVFCTQKVLGPDINLFLSQVIIHFTDGVDDSIEELEATSSTLHSEGIFFYSSGQ